MSAANKTIKEKMNELSEQVAWFDGDDFALEDALERFKKAEKLAEEIESDLSNLKNEVLVLKQKFTEGE